MRRRKFLGVLGGALAAYPLAAEAQQHDKIARVGVLGPSREKNPISRQGYAVFLAELRKLGFADGQNLQVEFGRTDEDMAGAFAAANEMMAHKADVLVANGPEVTLQAATAARPQVPIVMLATNFDPFARGYVKSLADPGGNITGIFYRQPELAAKQLELLVEAFPERKRIGTLWDIQSAEQANQAEASAQSMGLSLHSLKLENPPYNFDAAFQALARGDAQMLEVL
jgi:putative tryptophan/tyrosine transport system substrate-binding protein